MANVLSHKQSGDEGILPVSETQRDESDQEVSSQACASSAFIGTPSYRKHSRKRSSQVIVPPRGSMISDLTAEATTDSAPSMSASSFLQGTTALAGSQFLARMLTFCLNQVFIRFQTAEDLGEASRFEFYNSFILSISRDAVRHASQRGSNVVEIQDNYRVAGGLVQGTYSAAIQEIINIGWVPFVLVMVLVLSSEAYILPQCTSTITKWASICYALSCIVEISAEPFYLLVQRELRFKTRAATESLATLARCIVAFAVIITRNSPAIGNSLGQLAFAIIVLLAYYLDAVTRHRHRSFAFTPKKIWYRNDENSFYLNQDMKKITMGMYGQTVFKLILAESDRFVISFMLPLAKQGEYAFASNYGSLFARIVLFPTEETLRSIFSKCLGDREVFTKPAEQAEGPLVSPMTPLTPATPISAATPSNLKGLGIQDAFSGSENAIRVSGTSYSSANSSEDTLGDLTLPTQKPRRRARTLSNVGSPNITGVLSPAVPNGDGFGNMHKSHNSDDLERLSEVAERNMQSAFKTLTSVLRVYFYIGTFALIFGPLAGPYVLQYVFSARWYQTDAPAVVVAYFCYLPILAWNGALEAFIQSAASLKDLKQQGILMLILSALFLVQSWLFMYVLNLGAVGLVYAQAANMLFRIAWSVRYVMQYFAKAEKNGEYQKFLLYSIPQSTVLVAAGTIAFIATRIGQATSFNKLVCHFILAGSFAAVLLFSERLSIREFLQTLKDSKQKKD